MGWRETGIGAAIITGIVTLVTAYWQFVYKPAHLDQPPATIQYAGRVTDASSSNQRAIPKAKVSVDTQGVPQLYYSDSEGIFYVQLPSSSQSAHLRVEADGYETYDRIVSLSRTGVEIVPLKPLPTPTNQNSPTRPKSGNKHKDDRINRILSSEPSNRPG
ncbi:MAG TPA: carboxypeptidase-like regulatory domain-containing protein [Pyrinomonadaceae bacterium]|nr:carboxypeptidase-like regulatory domain-containing protein [Pyrinomonadaceae bacterium]